MVFFFVLRLLNFGIYLQSNICVLSCVRYNMLRYYMQLEHMTSLRSVSEELKLKKLRFNFTST